MYTVDDLLATMRKKGITLKIGKQEHKVTDCSECIRQLVSYLDSESLFRLSEMLAWNSLEAVICDWVCNKKLAYTSPVIHMYEAYFSKNWSQALDMWFKASYLSVQDFIPGYISNARDSYDLLVLLRYLPKEELKELVQHILFYTNDTADYCKWGANGDFSNWFSTMARLGYLKFEPYTLKDGDTYVFPIKYNRVLVLDNRQFKLMDGKSVYAYSGILPKWEDLCKCGEELATFIYYTAALSVAINCTDFPDPRNYVLLESFIQKLCATKLRATEVVMDAFEYSTDDERPVGGFRIVKNNAWDYIRWAHAEKVYIEIPGVMQTTGLTVDLAPLQKDAISKYNCKARMWSNDNPECFQLLSGIFALLGIIYNDKLVRVINQDRCMPAVNPHAYLVVDRLLSYL